MLGAIIGDIAGSRFEFNPTNDYNFELFSTECGFTDDTICTVAVADAIMRGIGYGESIHGWCRRYPHPMGSYGCSFQHWVGSDDPRPYGSFGNGAAMRVSPVAWYYPTRESVLEQSGLTAECTHNHREGIKGAQTTALAIFLALECRRNGLRPDPESIVNGCQEFSGYDLDLKDKDVRNRFDETCQGTVPVALWIIRDSVSFEDAVRRAVSLGADADTLGAITGSIAEAIWGIPEDMKIKAISCLPEDMRDVIRKWEQCLKQDRDWH